MTTKNPEKTSSPQHEVENSAGGVLIREAGEDDDAPMVCLIQVPTRGGNPSWRLPKGWIEPDETPRGGRRPGDP